MPPIRTPLPCTVLLLLLTSLPLAAQEKNDKNDKNEKLDTSRGDKMIAEYFAAETAKLQEACLADVETLEDWTSKREMYRQQLLEMLGLSPLPSRTELKPVVTGAVEHDDFVVENLHFQSRPGLYVTGNLYRPKEVKEPLPAILYVCGHGGVKKDGVSYGNKATYQHHGAWFARHGYVCLVIDTLQLGEIEGIHHGTYRYDRFWWLNRGYTSAGVEAWNCVRALDYLQSRKEVDGERLGVTGRSGGGAYSWWIAAIDQRIKCAVPVAGITDLENHVVDGTVEGHCDCMFMVNTYGWDYAQVAALVAPRPLLISNTDRDRIFPLEGVVRTHAAVRKIYQLYGVPEKLALQITAGPHKDTQELRVHAFRWFDFHLKGGLDRLIDKPAVKFFEPEQLKVFEQLPDDEQNTTIDETFTAKAEAPQVPKSEKQWNKQRDGWREALLAKTFRGWPEQDEPLALKEVFSAEHDGVQLSAYDFTSQGAIRLRLYLAHRVGLDKADLTVLNVLDDAGWNEFLATYRPGFEKQLADETLPEADEKAFRQTQGMFKSFKWAMAHVAPRGVGPTAWDQSERKQTQHRRRFYLLGQSRDGMRVYDVRRAAQALREVDSMSGVPLWLQAHRQMAGVALHASLFEPDITRIDLHELSATHREGPFLLNVSRILEMPAVVAMAAERTRVIIYDADAEKWRYPQAVVEKLGWDAKHLAIRKPAESP
ncbi:MAG: acetylxylan esterase [Pirellulaceae bacterium]